MSPDTDRRQHDAVDRLIEMALFAPIGLLTAARDALPSWVERGRQQLAAQVPVARAVGELAVRHGSKQARQGLERLRRQADDRLGDVGTGTDSGPMPTTEPASPLGRPDGPEPEPPPPAARAAPAAIDEEAEEAPGAFAAAEPGVVRESPGPSGPSGPSERESPGPSGPSERESPGPSGPSERESPAVGELPIPGYDTLSASQVVQRLPGLSMEELEAVRSYELAGRARKTVLLRVAQLRAAS